MSNIQVKLAELGRWVILQQQQWEMSVDGGDIQDKAVELGILIPTVVTASCGEECQCASYGDFPQTCMKLAEGVQP